MRRLILQEFVTLDGLAAGPGDSLEFIPAATAGDASLDAHQLAFIDSIDTILLGRKTYELFAAYWPGVVSGADRPFADRLNMIPRVVFSNTLERAPWGDWEEPRLVRGSAAEEVARLKQQSGKNLVVWGSISLARSLHGAGLIDEYQLILCPVVLGQGRPLFGGEATALDLELLVTKSFDRGTLLLAYAPNRNTRAGR